MRKIRIFDLLLGCRTYDLWADHWPKITSGPFAKAIHVATKYVCSSIRIGTLDRCETGSTRRPCELRRMTASATVESCARSVLTE